LQNIVIKGGARLTGEVRVSGSKNAALPILASSLLASGRSVYRNVPALGDVRTMHKLLGELGAEVETKTEAKAGGITFVDTSKVENVEAPYDLVKTMRASVVVLGPLTARHGRARVSLPGGCAIGARPIDQHLKGLAAMGAKIELEHGYVTARARRLQGATIVFDMVTVTGTENLMMAAALAKGHTTLENSAREPEVEELARVLNKMGARIQGAGTSQITIEGVDELQPIEHTIIPDRIEAGTLLVAAAITRGNVLVRDCLPEHLDAVIAKLRAAGVEITPEEGGLRARAKGDLKPTDISTQPFPGFPTDMQAQFMVLMTRAKGQSLLTETIFENRFMHVPELQRMGADIQVEGRTVAVRGPTRLTGAEVMATDLRASASLVLAGLIADGTTKIRRVYHGPRLRSAGQEAARAGRRRPTRPGADVKGRTKPAAAATRGTTAAPPVPARMLTLALPRGRILEEALLLFREAGIDLSAADKTRAGRRLIIPVEAAGIRVLIVRDTDVPAYVEGGAADLGIAGRDVLDEQGRDLYEPLDLGIGRCRMVVAEPEGRPVDEAAPFHLRYATKFPEITRRHLQSRGVVADVIKLYGSIEIAPLVGLADRIVDLVSSGETLRQHHLREVETILDVSARICVGRAAAKLHGDRIDSLIKRLRAVVR